jgi:hypothetical protein
MTTKTSDTTNLRTHWLPAAFKAQGEIVTWRESGRTITGRLIPAVAGYDAALVLDGMWLRPLWVTDEEAADILASSSYAPTPSPLDTGLTAALLWDADHPSGRLPARREALAERVRAKAAQNLTDELRRIGVAL